MKKFISFALTLLLVLTIIPTSVFAANLYQTESDTIGHNVSPGLSYSVIGNSGALGTGITADEYANICDRDMSTTLAWDSSAAVDKTNPWVVMDLGKVNTIHELITYGAYGVSEGSTERVQSISYSLDGETYEELEFSYKRTAADAGTANTSYYWTQTAADSKIYIVRHVPAVRFSARYIKVTFTTGKCYFSEISVHGADGNDINTSAGIGYTISSHQTEAITGITDDEWNSLCEGYWGTDYGYSCSSFDTGADASVASGPDVWFTADLGGVYDLTKLLSYCSNSQNFGRISSMEVSLDGVNFEQLTKNEDYTEVVNNNYSEDIFKRNKYSALYTLTESVKAKYVRIKLAKSSERVYLSEMCIFGTPSAGLPYLSGITPSAGELTTAFNAETTAYQVQVNDFENLPTLSFETLLEDASAVVTTEASAENNYTATITVTHQKETKDYTVQFIPYNWALAANGTEIASSGSSEDLSLMVDGVITTSYYLSKTKEITLTFEDYVMIEGIDALSTGTNSHSNFKVSYSNDGVNFTELRYVSETKSVENNHPNTSKPRWMHYNCINPVTAKYLKYQNLYTANSGFILNELQVRGTKLTEEEASNFTIIETTIDEVTKNLPYTNYTFVNNSGEAASDNYYIAAVYVDGSLHEVITVDKSAETVGAGAAAFVEMMGNNNIPEGSTVTAKLFRWSNPTTIVPVVEPITLK